VNACATARGNRYATTPVVPGRERTAIARSNLEASEPADYLASRWRKSDIGRRAANGDGFRPGLSSQHRETSAGIGDDSPAICPIDEVATVRPPSGKAALIDIERAYRDALAPANGLATRISQAGNQRPSGSIDLVARAPGEKRGRRHRGQHRNDRDDDRRFD
jgi:hypothetical protein